VDGHRDLQPLTLRLDPRVTTSAAGLAQLATLTRETYDGAVAVDAAYRQARALAARLDSLPGGGVEAFRALVDSLAPPPQARPRRFFRRRPAGPPTLESARDALLAAAMAMQGADVAPTAAEVAACTRARSQAAPVLARWTRLRTSGLAALNENRRADGLPPIRLP
jgi:hypothetical protein